MLLAISSAKNQLGFLRFRGKTPSASLYKEMDSMDR